MASKVDCILVFRGLGTLIFLESESILNESKTRRDVRYSDDMQQRWNFRVRSLVMFGILAAGLVSCANEPEERHWIDGNEARDGSVATMQLIRDLIPQHAIDTTQSLPDLAEHDAEPQICEGIETGNSGAALYYPGETQVPLAQDSDPDELIDELVNELHVEHGWRLATNMSVTADKEETEQGLVTEDDYMVALRAIEDDGAQLEISAWSACYSEDADAGVSDGNS